MTVTPRLTMSTALRKTCACDTNPSTPTTRPATIQTRLATRLLRSAISSVMGRANLTLPRPGRPLARRLHDAGFPVVAGDIRKAETYVKSDVGPATSIIVEDNGRQGLRHQ